MESVASSKTAQATTLAVVATDGELLMRFQRHRDQAAFAEVVERHGRLVWIVCKQALRHHQDVEDAFQATFLILAQRATTIRASDSAAAWLYRVAQRTAIAARRRRSRLREEPLTAEPPQGEEALPLIHDRQMMRVLMEELQSLPQKYQMPLVMQYFEGQSRRAIAEQTDSTLAQIQGRLVRGKRMLRSRLLRRGVSLSLATGAIATASTAASAAVSPSLVAATAASSSSIIASSATGSALPAAVELSKQGLNAMWYASLAKTVGTAASVLIVAGVLFAAQSGEDGLANVTVRQAATNGIDLQATVAAVAEEEEPAAIAIAAAEPAEAGGEMSKAGEISRTRQFELERNHWLLKARAYRLKSGSMEDIANTRGDNIDKELTDQERDAIRADAMLLAADAAMAEARAVELARQIVAAKANPDQGDDRQQERLAKQRDENERKITNLRALIDEYSTVRAEAELERERLEQAFLQRELEQLHEIYMQMNAPHANMRGKGGLPVGSEALETMKTDIQKRIEEKKLRLEEQRQRIAGVVRGLEKDKRERAGIERKLEYLEKANLQIEFPQPTPVEESLNVESKVSQLESENARLQQEIVHLSATRETQRTLMAELRQTQDENAALKQQMEGNTGSSRQDTAFDRLVNEEAGRITITDKEKVQALALPSVEPRTWQWRLFLPQGARYKWRAAAGDIAKDSLPEGAVMAVSNEPYWDDETEVLVTARLAESEDGNGRLVVTSRTTEQSQMAGITIDVPAEVFDALSRSSQDGRNLGDRGTKVLDPQGSIILLQKRALSDSDNAPSSDPRPGFIIWLESY